MNFPQLKSLLAVIDTGSFAAAAKELNLSQPAVSQHVRKLEQSLEANLVERGPNCAPTEQAHEFVRQARNLIKIAELAKQSLYANELRIGASSNVGTYLIQPLFARFIEEHTLDGKLIIDSNPAIAEKLHQGEIDVAAMEWWSEESNNARRFHNRTWKEEPLVLIVGPQHRWASRKRVAAEQLVGENILGGESGTGTGRIISDSLGKVAEKLSITQSLGSTEAVKEGVKAGLGVSIVIRSAVEEELRNGSLFAVGLTGVTLSKDIQLITSSDLPETACANRFCHFAMQSAT